jgi:hypothetical protein
MLASNEMRAWNPELPKRPQNSNYLDFLYLTNNTDVAAQVPDIVEFRDENYQM